MAEANKAFERNEESIGSLIRAADIYCQHVLALSRGQHPDLSLIEQIIKEKAISSLNYSWRFFMSPAEYQEFDKAGHLRRLCEHIVFASYVALESYLIDKFREVFSHNLRTLTPEQQTAFMKRLSFRNLDEIKRHYDELIGIKLAAFEPNPGVFDEAQWFQPKSSWEGIKILEKVRNKLAHTGMVDGHNIFVPVDAWSAFDFVRRWVALFESNFNEFIYDGRKSPFAKDCVNIAT